MNKLEQILAEFTKNFVCTDSDEEGKWEYIPDEADIPAQIRRFLADKLVEYARSVVPSPEEVVKEFFIGDKTLTQVYLDRIDQDLLSINTK